ncbi:MAG: hypothetical protein WCD79_23345 [Chthoniobacteraceae bacterium]
MSSRPPRSRPISVNASTVLPLLASIVLVAGIWDTITHVFDRAGVREDAYRASAENDETQIETAIRAFYTEYGRYPTPNRVDDDAYYGPGPLPPPLAGKAINMGSNALLIDVLRYNVSGSNGAIVEAVNPRKIVFIDVLPVKDASHPVSGVMPNGSPNAGAWFDPWGSAYNILVDANYDSNLVNPYADAPGGATIKGKACAIWSFGKNGVLGGGPHTGDGFSDEAGTVGNYYSTPGNSSGDVISWQ